MTDETAEKPAEPSESGAAAPPPGMLDLAESVAIERTGGRITAKVHHFPALTGWEIRRQYRDFLESKDSNFRIAFTVTVLSHSTIVLADREFNIATAQDVNDQLETWQNVELLFNAILGYNGIKTDAAESERRRWQVAGEDMASSFLAAVSSLIGPALSIAATPKDQEVS